MQLVSSTINSRSWCPIITVYSGNCVTLDSWTEFILTSTNTEKAHLKINITTNSIPLSLQHLSASFYRTSTAFFKNIFPYVLLLVNVFVWSEYCLLNWPLWDLHYTKPLLRMSPCSYRIREIFVWPWKKVSVTVCYLFFRPEVKKIITWACFSARLFTFPYFSVRSSRSNALRYGWPSAQ